MVETICEQIVAMYSLSDKRDWAQCDHAIDADKFFAKLNLSRTHFSCHLHNT